MFNNRNVHIVGYTSVFVTTICNMLLLPLVYRYLSPPQIGIWYNYVAIYSFVLLLDFGLTPTATRELGKSWILGHQRDSGVVNFLKILIAFKKIYTLIAIIAVIFCFLVALPYLAYLAKGEVAYFEIISSWTFNVFAIFVALKCLYLGPLSRAVDKISSFYCSTIVSKLVQFCLTAILLYVNFGLAAISIGFLGGILVNVLILKRIESDITSAKEMPRIIDGTPNLKILLSKTYKQGAISMSRFLQDKSFVFLLSIFYGLEITAKVGFFLQVFSIITSFANVFYKTNQNRIIRLITNSGVSESKSLLIKSLVIQSSIIVIGSLGLYLFWPYFSYILSDKVDLLDLSSYFVLSCYVLSFNLYLVCCNYLLILEDYSMLVPSMYTALIFVVVGSSLLYVWELDLLYLLIFQLLVTSIFNGLRWPYKIYSKYW